MLAAKKIVFLISIAVLVLAPVWAQTETTSQAQPDSLEDNAEQPEDAIERSDDENEEADDENEEQEDETVQPEDVIEPDYFGGINDYMPHQSKKTDSYAFSLSPLAGFLYGQGDEILYKYPGNDRYISRLVWDLKPLVYLGLGSDFCPRDLFQGNGIILSSSLKFGLPFLSGDLIDEDWLARNSEVMTNHSRHDAYSMNAIMADLKGGYSWRLTDSIAVGAFGALSFMYLSWSGEDGYYQYLETDSSGDLNPGETWTPDIPKTRFNGPVILYNQSWLTFSPGLQAIVKVTDNLSMETFISYSPLIYCAARDDHLQDNPPRVSWDYPVFGHCINGGMNFSYLLSSKVNFYFNFSVRHITGSRGKSYFQNTDSSENEVVRNRYDGGAGFTAVDFSLALRIFLNDRF